MITKQVLEERMKNLEINNTKEHLEIRKAIDEICIKLDNKFVTQDRFNPIEKLVYIGGGAVILWLINSILHLI